MTAAVMMTSRDLRVLSALSSVSDSTAGALMKACRRLTNYGLRMRQHAAHTATRRLLATRALEPWTGCKHGGAACCCL